MNEIDFRNIEDALDLAENHNPGRALGIRRNLYGSQDRNWESAEVDDNRTFYRNLLRRMGGDYEGDHTKLNQLEEV